MGIVQGTFIYHGAPRNGAIAKLWEASAFGAPPELDDPEPGAGQVGGTITTGVAYGGDGAYRWTGVADDAYYVSCYYDAHRVWMYHHVEDIDAFLTTQGDLLVRGAADLERLAIGANGQVLKMVAGVPAWADETLWQASDFLRNSNDAQQVTNNTDYVKVKETKLNDAFNGTIRIKFDLWAVGGGLAYGRIYHNGVAIGTERTATDLVTFSEDLVGVSWAVNDLIQIYAKHSTGAGSTRVQNFRFYYERPGLSITNQDP